MSDSWIIVIPTDPSFTPLPAAAGKAKAYLTDSIAAGSPQTKIEIEFFDQVQFVDAGANWSGVACPHCNLDAESWLYDAMDAAAEQSFTDLSIDLPCCGKSASLDDLEYVWPVGFSKFVLSAEDAMVPTLSPDQLDALANILGHRVRQVLRHI